MPKTIEYKCEVCGKRTSAFDLEGQDSTQIWLLLTEEVVMPYYEYAAPPIRKRLSGIYCSPACLVSCVAPEIRVVDLDDK